MQNETINGYMTSPQQRYLWLLQQCRPVLHAQFAARLDGDLKPDVLRLAVEKIVARHEILRTTFHRHPGSKIPVQVISDEADMAWRSIDLSGMDAGSREGKAEEILDEEWGREFDFERGPLLRAHLLTLSPTEHLLLLDLPSLCADAATGRVLVEEICRMYSACLAGRELEDEPLQYADFSAWQNDVTEGEDAEAGKKYWEDKGLPRFAPLTLPLERRGTANKEFAPRSVAMTLDADLAARVEQVCRSHDVSTPAYLLACWQTLLWRVTGRPEFVIEQLFDGRKYEELQQAVGLFARTLPITCHIDEKFRFSNVLRAAHKSMTEAQAWEDHYFPEQFSALGDVSLRPGSPPVSFDFRQGFAARECAGILVSLYKQRVYTDRFKLHLSCVSDGGSLIIEIHYDPSRFDSEQAGRMAERLHALLKSSSGDPQSEVGKLGILSDAEYDNVVVEFNRAEHFRPENACVHELFERQVERTPENIAVEFDDQRLTFSELNGRANRFAHYLRDLRVGPETVVALFTERSPEMIVCLLGVLKAGAAYLPVDPAYPKERVSFMLKDSGAQVIATMRHMTDRLPEHEARVVCVDSDGEAIARLDGRNPESHVTAENIGYVIYTSGSTGVPKGAAITHGGIVNYLKWCAKTYEVAEGGGAPVHSPLGFDLTVTSLFAPLLTGRPVVLLREDESLQALGEMVGAGRAFSLIKVTPSHLDVLNQMLANTQLEKGVGAVVVGGEALKADSVSLWQAKSPGTRVFNEYGPTETVVGCCVYEIPADSTSAPRGEIPIGRPIANTRIYILDSQMSPAPIGVTGQLHIGGAGLARGYLNRPDLTAEKFMPDPFSGRPGERLYKSGDLARHMPDGNIEFLGRMDRQVKVRGFRIEPGEIETTLVASASVREAVVQVREDSPGDQRLVAYIVPAPRVTPTNDELRDFLKDRLPEYMVPSAFVILRALPLTANGKVDLAALPALQDASLADEASYVAPRNDVDEVIAEIWAEILGRERVGIHNNFFEMGGHSLLVMQILARLQDSFQMSLPPRVLFDIVTVAGLADFIVSNQPVPGQVEKIAAILKRVEGMSEEEVADLLDNRQSDGAIA